MFIDKERDHDPDRGEHYPAPLRLVKVNLSGEFIRSGGLKNFACDVERTRRGFEGAMGRAAFLVVLNLFDLTSIYGIEHN
jgi:hypothetical protein